jgi:hypothetical protein
MGPDSETRKVVKAELVPWEEDQDLFGIAWQTADGQQGVDKIGTREQAAALLETIRATQSGESEPAGPFPRDIAAS